MSDLLIDIARAMRDLAISAHVEATKVEMASGAWEHMLTQRGMRPMQPYGGKVFGIPVLIDETISPFEFRVTYRPRIGV